MPIRMNKPINIASAVAAIIALVALALYGWMSSRGPSPDDQRRPEPVISAPAAYEQAPPEVLAPASVAKIESTEANVSAPVAYFPPPSIDLTGAKLGNQVVPGTDTIGDVFNLYFDNPTQTLFMAVVEPDELRSIWRLNEDGKAERVFVADTKKGDITIDDDGRGNMYVQMNNPARVWRTSDGFKTWQLVLEGAGNFWSIASDGRKTVYGALHDYNRAVLYRSPDDGFSWEPWIDFQQVYPEYAKRYAEDDPRFMMRHLHGVIYSKNSDAILVGTGDVARFTLRSDDQGQTWRKVWDEGFTAAVPLGGGNRYLLCPDSLMKHPLVIYDVWNDTIQNVWNPRDFGYAGYCYSLINADGIYYAAFHTEANEVEAAVPKSGIIASPDGVNWYPFLEWSPLGNHARTNIWLAVAPERVYASVNGALYAFKPLDQAWFEDKVPFGERGPTGYQR